MAPGLTSKDRSREAATYPFVDVPPLLGGDAFVSANSDGLTELNQRKKTHPRGCVKCCKANHRESETTLVCSAFILPNHVVGVEPGRLTFNHS
jgi:hypothetical protein